MFNDFGLLIAQYNSSLPTLSNGEFTELQVDSSGRLLVQADVTVLVDFLGLNGAADNANILVVGTEDGTSTGTAHALRLASNGAVIIDDGGNTISIDDGGGSITVDGTVTANQGGAWTVAISGISDGTDSLDINADGSINVGNTVTVQATDLDIRDITHVSDSIRLGDGTDLLEIIADGDPKQKGIVAFGYKDSSGNAVLPILESDGSIPVTIKNDLSVTELLEGVEEYVATESDTDEADGVLSVDNSWTGNDVATITLAQGDVLYIYGWQFSADANAVGRLYIDDGDNEFVIKNGQVTSAVPNYEEHFAKEGRIEYTCQDVGGCTVSVQVRAKNAAGANAAGSIHARKIAA